MAVKSLAFVPVVVMLEIVWRCLSLFVITVVIGSRSYVPWLCATKVRLLGDTLIGAIVGTTPAPLLR